MGQKKLLVLHFTLFASMQTGPFLFAVFVQVNWQLLKLTKLDYTSLKTDADNGSCCQKIIASCREEEKLNQKSCG